MTDQNQDTDQDTDDCANQFGMYCPSCGESDGLDIAATVWVRLMSDGTDADESHDGSHEWDDDSACQCDCGWAGTVKDASPEKESTEQHATVFEVTAIGFDGGTDATDDRVLWVRAPDRSVLNDTLADLPHQGGVLEVQGAAEDDIDYRLPADTDALRAKLRDFAATPPEPEVDYYTNYYLHCGQHWRDKWSCMCNDHCPVCDKEIEPYKSVDAEGEVTNHVGDELPTFEQGEDDE